MRGWSAGLTPASVASTVTEAKAAISAGAAVASEGLEAAGGTGEGSGLAEAGWRSGAGSGGRVTLETS